MLQTKQEKTRLPAVIRWSLRCGGSSACLRPCEDPKWISIVSSGPNSLNLIMVIEHPFQTLFETLGRVPSAQADSVNRRAYEVIHDLLSVPLEKSGRCILLRAPRAGHGKTHLLSRIQHHLGATHAFIPLNPVFGCNLDAGAVIDDALRFLSKPLPASGGLCELDILTRRWFALALQPLVISGEVPSQDRDGALEALVKRPAESFDFHHPEAVIAHWARDNFDVLGPRLGSEIAQRSRLPSREVTFWVNALFQFATARAEDPGRLGALADSIHDGASGERVLVERLEALLGMLALLMRVVLVADDLEGFSADPSAASRLVAFVGRLRQSVEKLDVILSLNQDIWEKAFLPRLSDGLADRLSEVVVELAPLTEDEMLALLESRAPGLGARLLSEVDRAAAGTHARGLIRAAGVAWLRASASDSQPSDPPQLPIAPEPAIASISPVPVISQSFETTVQQVGERVPKSLEFTIPPAIPEELSAGQGTETGPDQVTPDEELNPIQAQAEAQPDSLSPAEVAPRQVENEAAVASAAPGVDRVDELLRQFRERYGRR
jgi:hypothetical protein